MSQASTLNIVNCVVQSSSGPGQGGGGLAAQDPNAGGGRKLSGSGGDASGWVVTIDKSRFEDNVSLRVVMIAGFFAFCSGC